MFPFCIKYRYTYYSFLRASRQIVFRDINFDHIARGFLSRIQSNEFGLEKGPKIKYTKTSFHGIYRFHPSIRSMRDEIEYFGFFLSFVSVVFLYLD